MAKARYNVLIDGKVQQGGFRSFIKKHAIQLGVTGYAENLPTGEVVSIFEGEEEDLKKLIDLIEKEAPKFIKVKSIKKKIGKYRGSFTDFERRGKDVLEGLEEKGVKEILLDMASSYKSMDSKLEKGIEILGSIDKKQDTMIDKQDTMLEKQDTMLEKMDTMIDKQDETISVIKDEGKKTRTTLKDHLTRDIARLYDEIDEIKATLARVVEKVGA
jgi:acylphosphatase